jgi:uncharacterized repeat protein (TIGR03806 family)
VIFSSRDGYRARGAMCALALLSLGPGTLPALPDVVPGHRPYGIDSRVVPPAYLRMPPRGDMTLPPLLSQTGAFSDLRHLIPAKGLMNYELVVPFWSDRAVKTRWVAVPKEKIKFFPMQSWIFPKGTVFVKTFELPTDAADPTAKRRLETRLLVSDSAGGVYGATYKWRPDNSEADLLATRVTEDISIKGIDGKSRIQTWYYPSRQDCLACHTARAGGVLGAKTRQLNRDLLYPSGVTDNELRTWNHLGMFTPGFSEQDVATFVTLAAANDTSRSLEDRARSYLDANCSHCHQPGGTVANFDARYTTPLDEQQIINGPILIDQGIDRPRVISPHDPWRSIMFMRANTNGDIRMPPLARETIDLNGMELLRRWIDSMPGRAVLDPPVITPSGGTFDKPVAIVLSEREPGADIRYTLDGSVPGPTDQLYSEPIDLEGPTVLRTRAYKEGFTRSIAAQEVFVVSP